MSIADSAPTFFGSYELLAKLATGGMAEVYRARVKRPGGVSKIVCLKRIHPALCADPAFVDMFIEEARLGLTLSHGNIVPVFDFGCIDGYHFLVMELVEGRDLAQVVARSRIVDEPFPPELALTVVAEVLEGLAYAHGRRDEGGRPLELVHRDISPSNVMISDAGEVKILDFGIARSALREFRTRTGVVKGKPGYMAPEQARGEAVDARVDIFACGVMLRELITGARPTGVGAPDATDEAPDEDVEIDDQAIAVIAARAMSQDPDARYQSARDMAAAVLDLMAERGWRARPAEIARWVRGLFEARAASPDWTHGADAVDRHLAALVEESLPPEGLAGDLEAGASEESTKDLQARRRPTPAAGEGGNDGDRTEELTVRPAAGEGGIDGDRTEEFTVRPAAGEGGTDGERTEELTVRPAAGEAEDAAERRAPRRGGWIALVVALLIAGAGALAVNAFDRPPGPTVEQRPPPSRAPALAEPARVDLRTTPAGARIVIDGERLERRTPTQIELPAGSHRLELSAPGHAGLIREVELEAGERLRLELTLRALPGTLRVTSRPTGATVHVNGREVGTTPWEGAGLDRRATYLVVVTSPGWQRWEREVSFRDQAVLEVEAELSRSERPAVANARLGFLSVVAVPWAEVLLDGRSLGETPVLRRRVTAGRHDLVLRNRPLGVEVRRAVLVVPGQEARVSVDLTEGRE